ncbi:hypothetical protein MMC29_003772 [Sticta canariensis]|nr:hypothetical protein [Sticta canariensis]
MITIRRRPSILHLLSFLAIATFLASPGRRGNALASPIGSDTNDDALGADGYPTDKQVRAAFVGVGVGQTVLGAGGVPPGAIWLFATSTARISLYNGFQPSIHSFLYEGYGPKQGYSAFFERCTRYLIRQSSGKVWVLSDWPNGPDERGDCNIWTKLQFPLLTQNNKVTSIWLVDRNAFKNRKQIWPNNDRKADEPKTPDPSAGDPISNRRRFGRPKYGLAPLVGVGGSAGLTLGTGIGGLGTLPLVPAYHDSDDQSSEDGGVKTDVLDDVIGKLPSTFNQATGGDETATWLGAGENLGTSGADESGNVNLFDDMDKDWSDFSMPARRHLSLQPREGTCTDWFSGSSTNLFPPSPFDQPTDQPIVLPGSNYVAPGALPSVATVQVTQYEENSPKMEVTGHCHLEISILNSGNEVMGGLQVTDAPPGQDLIVWSKLPYALRVSVDSDQTLFFKYAWDTPYATSWDMNHQYDEHACQIGPWNTGVRGVYCLFSF